MEWDVRTPTGTLVQTLPGLAAALGTSVVQAAHDLLGDVGLTRAAPLALVAEAKAAAKPKGGGDTPPEITSGSFVSWSGGKGRVDLIVRKGKVPGVKGDTEATSDSPAARIVVWKDGKATTEKIAASTHTLKRIAPLDKPEGKSDPASTLVALVTGQNRRVETLGLPEHRRVTGAAVKTAYQRGLDGYPSGRTDLSPQEWAVGRAEHFVKVANEQVSAARAGHDVDLLHKSHPLNPEHEEDVIVLTRADLDMRVKALLDVTPVTSDDGTDTVTLAVDDVAARLAAFREATT